MLGCLDIEGVLGKIGPNIHNGIEGGNKALDKCVGFLRCQTIRKEHWKKRSIGLRERQKTIVLASEAKNDSSADRADVQFFVETSCRRTKVWTEMESMSIRMMVAQDWGIS